MTNKKEIVMVDCEWWETSVNCRTSAARLPECHMLPQAARLPASTTRMILAVLPFRVFPS